MTKTTDNLPATLADVKAGDVVLFARTNLTPEEAWEAGYLYCEMRVVKRTPKRITTDGYPKGPFSVKDGRRATIHIGHIMAPTAEQLAFVRKRVEEKKQRRIRTERRNRKAQKEAEGVVINAVCELASKRLTTGRVAANREIIADIIGNVVALGWEDAADRIRAGEGESS